MNKKVLIVSDEQYSDSQNGGAESNNNELIKTLLKNKIQCGFILTQDLNQNINVLKEYDFIILTNFYFISEETKNSLYALNYSIIEHDYKFLLTRNPCYYKDFLAPPEQIIHKDLYEKAKFILVQSDLQKQIFEKNLNLSNIVNFSGNLWAEETLDLIEALSYKSKNGKACIIGTDDHGIKGKDISIEFCKKVFLQYDLIPKLKHHDFLKFISDYSTYVFFPRTPETLSRVCIEAKLMNLSVITSPNTAAVKEEFYKLNNKEMIDYLRNKPNELFNLIKNNI